MIQRVACNLIALYLLLSGALIAGQDNVVMPPTSCTSITSCMECLETPECGTWQSSEYATCQSSCSSSSSEDCFSLKDFPGQSSDVICGIAANAQADATLCDNAEDCSECVTTILNDGSSSCQWFVEDEFCSSACKANAECGATTCVQKEDQAAAASSSTNMDALCNGLSCNFCIDLNCAWAPSVGCFASCEGITTNCLDGSQHAADDICTPPTSNVSKCDGLACDFCLGVGSCAWSDGEGCVESCDQIADSRCFPSGTYEAADVCNNNNDEPGGGDATETNSTSTNEDQAGQEDDQEEDAKCMAIASCEECLNESCDWVPEAGCIGNCSVFDTSCYPGEVYSAYQVCEGAAGFESETSGGVRGSSTLAFAFAATVLSIVTLVC